MSKFLLCKSVIYLEIRHLYLKWIKWHQMIFETSFLCFISPKNMPICQHKKASCNLLFKNIWHSKMPFWAWLEYHFTIEFDLLVSIIWNMFVLSNLQVMMVSKKPNLHSFLSFIRFLWQHKNQYTFESSTLKYYLTWY